MPRGCGQSGSCCPCAVVVAAAAGYGIHQAVHSVAPKTASALDEIRTTVTVAAFFGAVLAGIYAYRKQRLAEGDARRADAEQLASRYTSATEQLGHAKPAVRLGGVYAMARLADDWPEQRQTCIDVLCAYLRMPYEPDPDAQAYERGESWTALSAPSPRQGSRSLTARPAAGRDDHLDQPDR